ncbi:MAG: type I-E CRISPR-associated protein Cas6/Cse3/CasE [Planctomycetes bacterium]|nr:type I-E CRISPR-associated protein Cas6/Cse3/CasE [Planctomycetota bacterium]
MYLSCLLIDVGADPDRPRPARLWLRNLYHVHQRLCMAFPSPELKTGDPAFLKPYEPSGFRHVHGPRTAEQAFLFRIDPQPGGRVVILVQSAVKPDWGYAFHNARHFLAADPLIKEFNPRFEMDQRLQFRLVANPTRKIDTKSGPNGRRRHGRRVPVPVDQLHEWLNRRAEPSGFALERLTGIQPGYVYFRKPVHDEVTKGAENAQGENAEQEKRKGQRLRSARYDGILRITDPARFQQTLVSGIGPAKAFGFGLLSLGPPQAPAADPAKAGDPQ